ncbi:uncharacterized protein JN550_013158 [Neoarthrinium moseri]|uniref:uncharacterized protein n=1 Tax=Neoarthrinium moseri TaxID=1658444 RepID=UPI001FDC4A7B|nr:uncharacterized protein JN550_013158 [Neoarthrinium moseri]KAI1857589.1 hypothetical protein JN550_013158 [Neoarthrinium moseri]
MADPFSLAASAAGIVSLGLTVCSGLASYIDGIRDRKSELSTLSTQAQNLQATLSVLKGAESSIVAMHPAGAPALESAFKSVKEQLQALELFLKEQQDASSQSSGMVASLKEQKRKLTFAFHRPTLEKLQKKLDSANGGLQIILHVLGLAATAAVNTTISEVNTTVNDSHSTILSVESGIRSLETSMSSMSLSTTTIIREELAEVKQYLMAQSRLLEAARASTDMDPSQLALGRLLSKPSDLRDACDIYQRTTTPAYGAVTRPRHSQQSYGSSTIGTQTLCDCELKMFKQQQCTTIRNFHLIRKATTRQRHVPGCEFEASDPLVTEQVRQISYTGFRSLLSVALELSISWSSGAGGSSIARTITFRPMVDETKSPVFRIINLLRKFYTWPNLISKGMTDDIEHVLELATGAILRVSRASYPPITVSSVRRLMAGGLAGCIFDYSGRSPFDVLLESSDSPYSSVSGFMPVFDMMCSLNSDTVSRSNRSSMAQTRWPFALLRWDVVLNKYPHMAEPLGFGPLSISIVSGNEAHVRSLLSKDPTAIEEINHVGQTVFHLAASHATPELLNVLLETVHYDSKKYDTADACGMHAMDLAAKKAIEICRNGDAWDMCTQCACCASFRTLRSYGWQPFRYCSDLCRLLYETSHACRLEIISTIKKLKEELREIGRQCLSPSEVRRFHLDRECVLDGHTDSVIHALLRRERNIPERYRDIKRTNGASIYHTLSWWPFEHSVRLADLLFSKGFEDVDHEMKPGITPLVYAVRCAGYSGLPFMLWLVRHGADILRPYPIPEAHWLNPSHTVAHEVLNLRNYRDPSDIMSLDFEMLRELTLEVASLTLLDECRCGCVEPRGCTTTTTLFRWSWISFFERHANWEYQPVWTEEEEETHTERGTGLYTDNESPRESMPEGTRLDNEICSKKASTSSLQEDTETDAPLEDGVGEPKVTPLRRGTSAFSYFLRRLAVELTLWKHVSTSALRYFTFQALDLRHTCDCRKNGKPYSDDEINEMHEEDRVSLGLLDELVDEFTTELHDSGDTFARFLNRYWVGRMETVLHDLEEAKMTADQVLAAEQVGVRWDTDSNGEGGPSRPPPPTDSEIVEGLINQINEIVAAST